VRAPAGGGYTFKKNQHIVCFGMLLHPRPTLPLEFERQRKVKLQGV